MEVKEQLERKPTKSKEHYKAKYKNKLQLLVIKK